MQVVKEALRLYPPAPSTSRTLTTDVTLDEGIVLPAGTDVWVPIQSVQHGDINWDDPMVVRPERFDAGRGGEPGAWVPFSNGPRNCLGMRFALLEATVLVAMAAQHLSFTLAPTDGAGAGAEVEAPMLPCEMAGVLQRPAHGVVLCMAPVLSQ